MEDLEKSDLNQKYSLAKLREMFTVADLAKFAKYTPAPDENERSYITVAEFVEATKPVEEPEKEENDTVEKELTEEKQNE